MRNFHRRIARIFTYKDGNVKILHLEDSKGKFTQFDKTRKYVVQAVVVSLTISAASSID